MDTQKMIEWIAVRDTGTSSKTMWYALMGLQCHTQMGFDIPYDASDFRRCYDLVLYAGVSRAELSRIGEVFTYWRPVLDVWDACVAAYEEEDMARVHALLSNVKDESWRLREENEPKE